ncbi:hypothetical protein AOLI_G00005160 [Acnodon oligacanthus]
MMAGPYLSLINRCYSQFLCTSSLLEALLLPAVTSSTMATRSRPGFSSQSYSPSSARGSPSISSTNLDPLLNPPVSKVDPLDQQAKTKEKDQMVGLNDKFVAFIDKVCHLEEAQLKMGQDSYKANTDNIVKEVAADLRQQIEGLDQDRQKLASELAKSEQEQCIKQQEQASIKAIHLACASAALSVSTQCECCFLHLATSYEDEIQKKTDLENDFILTKIDDMVLKAGKHGQEISDIQRNIQRLMAEIEALKKKKISLEDEIRTQKWMGSSLWTMLGSRLLSLRMRSAGTNN